MKKATLIFVILVSLLTFVEASKHHNQYQPVIGILTQPSNDLDQGFYPADKYSYIASSYVKWMEASGARVIPIPYDLPTDTIDVLFSKINGLIFPGGDASLWVNEDTLTGFSNMTLQGQRLLNKVIETNKNGTHFPLWGTCLGYELVILAITNNDKALSFLNSTNHVLNTSLYPEHSKIYPSFDKDEIKAITEKKANYYNHRYGVSLKNFAQTSELNSFFRLTAFALDSNQTPFVATLEAKDYPIYVHQYHPEKNSYEWLSSVQANHSPEAIKVAQTYGNFFVQEARKNQNRFSEDEIMELNIERSEFKVVDDAFVSVYVYKNQNFTETAHPSQMKSQ